MTFRALLVGVLLTAASCTSDVTGPTIAREYALESIGGAPLPVVLMEDYDFKVSVVSDVITLHDDSTFIEVAHFRGDASDGTLATADTVTGTYDISRETILFLLPGAQVSRMTIVGNTLSQAIGPRVFVYRRR
jgi:hypothetical protein